MNIVKSIYAFIWIILFSLTSSWSQSKDAEWEVQHQAIEDLLAFYHQGEQIPAIAVAVIKDGELKQEYLIGKTQLENGAPISSQSLFQLGSLSKLFTGILARTFQESGQIDFQKPITFYLAESLSASAIEKLQKVLVKDVLQHRAGFPNHGPSTPPTPNGIAMRGGYSKALLIKDLEQLELPENPQENFSYSNFGYGVMALIMETVSGQSYESLLQEYLTQVYQMPGTTSEETGLNQQQLVRPYFIGKRDRPTQAWQMGYEKAAGGIFSSLQNLSQLMIQQSAVYQQEDQDHPLFMNQTQAPMPPIRNQFYGIGFIQSISRPDSTIVKYMHGGDLDGFASQYVFYPKEKLGYIILTSSGGPWINELDAVIEKVLLNVPLREMVPLERRLLKRFAGKYRFNSGTEIKIEASGDKLHCHFKGADPIRIYPASETKVFFRSMDVQIELDLDAKGKTKGLIYYQGTEPHSAKKIK